jgi:hypothetical protein
MMGFDTGALLPLDKALQGMLEQLTCCCETERLPRIQALDWIPAEISSPSSSPLRQRRHGRLCRAPGGSRRRGAAPRGGQGLCGPAL